MAEMLIAIGRVGNMDNQEISISFNKKIVIPGAIILVAIILFLYFSGYSIVITKNRTSAYIESSSKTIYKTEETNYTKPMEFKTTIIDANEQVWLGYAVKNNVYYYCLHAQTYIRSNSSNQVLMKVELVFTEEEWLSGQRLDGHASFYNYSSSFYDWETRSRVYVNVDKDYVLKSNIDAICLSILVDNIYNSQAVIFMRFVISSFDDFLKANGIKEFHRK